MSYRVTRNIYCLLETNIYWRQTFTEVYYCILVQCTLHLKVRLHLKVPSDLVDRIPKEYISGTTSQWLGDGFVCLVFWRKSSPNRKTTCGKGRKPDYIECKESGLNWCNTMNSIHFKNMVQIPFFTEEFKVKKRTGLQEHKKTKPKQKKVKSDNDGTSHRSMNSNIKCPNDQ